MQSIFSTLTFNPKTHNSRDAWLSISTSTNRYVQCIRRTVDYCEFLKVYELHKNGMPHVHILFIFRNLNYSSNNTRWLPHDVYQKLKYSWTLGLSDHQQPIANSDYSAVKYILKYVTKGSATHLWTKILDPTIVNPPPLNDLGYPIKSPKYAKYHQILVLHQSLLLSSVLKWKRIKLLTWSRGFIKSFINTKHS